MVIRPFATFGLAHGPKTCQIWHKLGPDFVECRSLKPSHEKKIVMVSSRWSRLRGPMITAQSRLGLVTAQSRRGHSSVTARSQLSHGEVTAQSQRSRLSHG